MLVVLQSHGGICSSLVPTRVVCVQHRGGICSHQLTGHRRDAICSTASRSGVRLVQLRDGGCLSLVLAGAAPVQVRNGIGSSRVLYVITAGGRRAGLRATPQWHMLASGLCSGGGVCVRV